MSIMRTELMATTAAFAPPERPGGAAAPQADPDRLLDEAETCKLTGLSARTLQRMRLDGSGPRFAKLGRRILYRRGDVLAWVTANTHDSTSAATVAAQRGRTA
jgi:predicted DNA-binding transcriptional regulator AlpA